MNSPRLDEVFKVSGIPTFTFVEPTEYPSILHNLRTPGRALVIEGPSGIGKTSAVENALRSLGLSGSVTKLSARKPRDVVYIEGLPDLGGVGIVIVDDFHRLAPLTRSRLADYIKTLADEESDSTKVVIVGINNAGKNLVGFASDLVNRIDVIKFETNSDEKLHTLLQKGEDALNISIPVVDDIIRNAQGSFYIAQMLASETCKAANILGRQPTPTPISNLSFEGIKANVWDRLAQVFRDRCERFSQGTKMRREGRAPYLHILRWLGEGTEWTLSLRDSMRRHPELSGSVGQVVKQGYLRDLINSNTELGEVLHFDQTSEQITIEDPQFLFFIRNIPWRQFASDVGFLGIDFPYKYDFALSFAGEDREVAEAIFRSLQEEQVEVFYDKNEQHRILASSVEDYLRPIYQSEARFVVVLLGPSYPKKVWTKFESDAFKARVGRGAVIPIWFSSAPPGIFDVTLQFGGLYFDTGLPMPPQIAEITRTIVAKLGETRS